MREEAIKVLGGIIVTVFGLAGYLFFSWAIATRLKHGRPLDEIDGFHMFFGVIGLVATALFLHGIAVIRRGLRDLREAPSRKQLDLRPWLHLKAWRRREIVYRGPVGYVVLLLAYLFFGLPAVLLLFAAIAGVGPEGGAAQERISFLLLGCLLALVVGGLTFWRLRQVRYGNSVCRLITLPGVVGGWFKADVICNLPADSDNSVLVRLKNTRSAGKHVKEVWRMEQRMTVPVTPGSRSTIPVRLQIPRDPAQQPMRIGDGFWSAGKAWFLEIEKQVPGINFLAAFHVPIYDTSDVPASDQEEGYPPPNLP